MCKQNMSRGENKDRSSARTVGDFAGLLALEYPIRTINKTALPSKNAWVEGYSQPLGWSGTEGR